jgi:hypothetical protein
VEELTQKLMKKREIDDQIKNKLTNKEKEEHSYINPTQSEDPKFHTKFVKKSEINSNGLGSEMALINSSEPCSIVSKKAINTIDVITFNDELLSKVASKTDKVYPEYTRNTIK